MSLNRSRSHHAPAELLCVVGLLLSCFSTSPSTVLAWTTTTPSTIALRHSQGTSLSVPTRLSAQGSKPGGARRRNTRRDDSDSGDASESLWNINDSNGDLATSLQQQAEAVSSNMTVGYYEKHERLLQVRSQIDRLLQGPDPPFDMQAELKKVKHIAPPAGHLQNPTDLQLEDRVMQLEHEIQTAIKQQDFDRAVQAQQEIGQLHVDDCGAVLQVNAQYYKAFSGKDYQQMQAVWLKDGTATCIHPSQKALVGSKSVLESFDRMFASSSGAFQKSWMEPVNIRISIKGTTTAVVMCDEHVYARRFIRGQKRQTELVNKLTTTNIFRKVSGRWFLTHHHASWHADSQAAKQALAVKGPGSSEAIKNKKDDRTLSSSVLGADFDEEDDDDDEDHDNNRRIEVDDSVADVGMDGILGIPNFGPLLGEGKKKDAVDDKKGKRVVMGSLSDILGGDLGDILGGSGQNGDSSQGKAIFRVFNNNKNQAEMSLTDAEMVGYDDDDDEEDYAAQRRMCISALRKLTDMGAISPQHKRVLITDIVTCSATDDQTSLVEIAHHLLLGSFPGADDEDSMLDVAMEEFAEQCRVIASGLLEKETASSISQSSP